MRDIKSIEPDKRNPDFLGSVTVLGMLKGVKEDYVVEVTGEWEKRRDGNYFPWQFKAADYIVCEFETPVLMQRFLSSLKSAGPETARRIMRIFPDPQKAIEENPAALVDRRDKLRARGENKSRISRRKGKTQPCDFSA